MSSFPACELQALHAALVSACKGLDNLATCGLLLLMDNLGVACVKSRSICLRCLLAELTLMLFMSRNRQQLMCRCIYVTMLSLTSHRNLCLIFGHQCTCEELERCSSKQSNPGFSYPA